MKPTSIATSTASGGLVGALVIVFTWLLSFWEIIVPAEIGVALMVIITPFVHILAVKLRVPEIDPFVVSAIVPQQTVPVAVVQA